MQKYEELINELAELCGIIPDYWDIFGTRHITPFETKKKILKAMRLNIESEEEIIKEINRLRIYPWNSIIEPVYIFSVNNQPVNIPLYIQLDEDRERGLSISWYYTAQNSICESISDKKPFKSKKTFEPGPGYINNCDKQWFDGKRFVKILLPVNENLDIGYYLLSVECKHPENIFPENKNKISKTSRIIITPDRCYMPQDLENTKTWGLSINLYALGSEKNWGIGDLRDLAEITSLISELKGDCVGLNPLHYIPNTIPYGISPYSPISRLFRNYLYIAVGNMPEIKESKEIQKYLKSTRYLKKIKELKESELIDYEKIVSLKKDALRKIFEYFYENHYLKCSEYALKFKEYIKNEGQQLENFALFLTLNEKFRFDFNKWPEKYKISSNKDLELFAQKHKKEILFHEYLQWQIDRQLSEISKLTKETGMRIGLYLDLAVGSIRGGFDVWNYPDIIAENINLGAPPDDFNINGQNWGFPPLIPDGLKDSGYELFIQIIRKNMKYAGALRIDHALGLFRLFWIPEGEEARNGAYVKCYAEDLIRIIALESVLNKTIVIGEDLGTIGENARETLQKFGILSYRLFYFERKYPDPSFLEPEKYPELALCSITTHDLPTIYGWWYGKDNELKKQFNMFKDNTHMQKYIDERERDKKLMLFALKSKELLPPQFSEEAAEKIDMNFELCLSIYEFLSLTPCKLLMVSLDDIIGALNQQNLPGTIDEHPNWKQKYQISMEELRKDQRFFKLSSIFLKNQRGRIK